MQNDDWDNDTIARLGEALACQHLEAHGWEILERNWARDIGELDIIAQRQQTWGRDFVTQIAFIEVKTREASRGPLPEMRVDHVKRRKLVTLAKLYLAENRLKRVIARFDVVGVDLDTEAVRHHPAAFDATGRLC